MLFLPLFDHGWRIPTLPRSRSYHLAWTGLLLAVIALLTWRPSEIPFAVATFTMAAIPEEWFFRAYFMERMPQKGWRANIVTSFLFSLLHLLTRGEATALLVFFPSLFYGWLYQRTRDLPLLVLAHTLSNLAYVMFVSDKL